MTLVAQDEEYTRQATEAWEEAVKIAYSEDGWKEEKKDSKTVRTSTIGPTPHAFGKINNQYLNNIF